MPDSNLKWCLNIKSWVKPPHMAAFRGWSDAGQQSEMDFEHQKLGEACTSCQFTGCS
jgi:hypothetical protein